METAEGLLTMCECASREDKIAIIPLVVVVILLILFS